jgi:hypothetical protein
MGALFLTLAQGACRILLLPVVSNDFMSTLAKGGMALIPRLSTKSHPFARVDQTRTRSGYVCCGADEGARTPDLLITNQLLYRLSYIGTQNGDAGVSVASGAGDGNRTHALSLGS